MSGEIDFTGATVIVTGAADGQGLAEASAFARLGARVVMADVAPAVLDRAEAMHAAGLDVVGVIADVASEEDWKRVLGAVPHGHVDVLVNNAGIVAGRGIRSTDVDTWRRSMDVNVLGPMLGIRAVIESMIERGQGCIVNVGSVAAFGGYWIAPYSVSKWALRGLSQVAAAEFGGKGVRCVAVHPGIVETKMASNAAVIAGFTSQSPTPRAAAPEEIATVVVFLASEAGGFLNGTEIIVDGGLLAAAPFAEIRNRLFDTVTPGRD